MAGAQGAPSDVVQLPAEPVGVGSLQHLLGLAGWQWRVAVRRGLLPAPDIDGPDSGLWSPDLVAVLLGEADAVREAVGTGWPVGLQRTADRLSSRTGMAVETDDVRELVNRGLLEACDLFEGRKGDFPLYASTDADLVDASALEEIIADRERNRLLGSDQAAKRLGIRASDWKWIEPAGWIAPVDHAWRKVGRTGRREVLCRLYRAEDVDALLEIPGVDWDEVRACDKGDGSPLRAFAPKLAPGRAELIRRWIAEFADLNGLDVWARYDGRDDTWIVDWDPVDGHPTKTEIRRAAADEPALAPHLSAMVFGSTAGEATRWARAMLEPGAAVILDTETTGLDGVVVEIAVIDAATGKTLLNTLVDPGDVAMEPGAQAVHGITGEHLAGAPTWDKVVAKVRKATKDRVVLAYNAEFDRRIILGDCARYRVKPMHLADTSAWGCVMNRRSDHLGIWRWVALGGGHRALGDCRSARDVLIRMAGQAQATPGRA
ncbi:3'-5' exonuclease [Actinosynnema sp. NPDC023587]|uniref:3'-5' exonuclease n=1 Tax=Actinosynnema sp. NPDC023587 TaxID=3154695 RepID=UPI0033F6A33A